MKKSPRSLIWILIIVSIFISILIVTYWKLHWDTPQQFKTQNVQIGDVRQTVSANGTINPVTLVNVGTQVSGTVKNLYVDFNSKVKKGEILLELDDSLLSAQLRQSDANVQNAQASLDLAIANEKRTRDLFKLEYVSQQDLDTALQAKKSAEAQFLSARAQFEKDRANLSYTVIRSPVSGVVVDREVDIGQTVAASLQTPTLFKIAQDLSKMQIDSNFAEADIGNIRVGQLVRFTVDAFSDRHFQGYVRQIRLNPTTVSNVVTYDVVINVDNPEQILLPGMTAYVSIIVKDRKNVLLVPNAALRYKPSDVNLANSALPTSSVTQKNAISQPGNSNSGKKSKIDPFLGKVYVLANGKLKQITVNLGITDNQNTEITNGDLKADDLVVIGEIHDEEQPTSSGRPPMRLF